MRLSTFVAAATLLVLILAGRTPAATIFSGSGNNPEASATASGTASFSISGDTLTLVLTNTTSPRTTAQGNALTGVAFDVDSASPVLSLAGTALDGASRIWTSELASNTSDPLAGSWTNVLGATPLAAYGIATTGFNGRFNGGSISLGNSSPNYGIVAAGTFDGTNVAFGGSQFPFIQNAMAFTFTGLTGISESQIANVKLLFGTDGTGIITTTTTTTPVPEPVTSVLTLGAVVGLAYARARRRWKI